MGKRFILLALGAAAFPCAPAFAQESRPVNPSIPEDFRLPPSESEGSGVQGPTLGPRPVQPAASSPGPTPTAAANSPSPQPSAQTVREPSETETAERSTAPTPAQPARRDEPVNQPSERGREDISVDDGVALPADNSESVAEDGTRSDPPPTPATQNTPIGQPVTNSPAESGLLPWLIVLAALLAALAGWLALRRNRPAVAKQTHAGAQPAETLNKQPVAAEPVANADNGQSSPPVPPAKADPLPQPSFDPASLVSIRPRTAQRPAAPAPPTQPAGTVTTAGNGLVSTNLAAKRRAEAEAAERAKQQARERSQPARPVVKGSISFDWS